MAETINQTPEQKARDRIDVMLKKAEWAIQDKNRINFRASLGVAIRHYNTQDGKEIDFLFTRNEVPSLAIEVKWADDSLSPNFAFFDKQLEGTKKIQLVKKLKREKTYPNGAEIRLAHKWLAKLSLK